MRFLAPESEQSKSVSLPAPDIRRHRYLRREFMNVGLSALGGLVLITSFNSVTAYAADEPLEWRSLVTENNKVISEGAGEDGKTKVTPIATILIEPEAPFQIRFRMTVEPLPGEAPKNTAGGLIIAANNSTEGAGTNILLVTRFDEHWWMAQNQGQGTAGTGKPITRDASPLPESTLSLSPGRSHADLDVPELGKIINGYQLREPLKPNNPEGLLLLAAISTKGSLTIIRSLDLLIRQ